MDNTVVAAIIGVLGLLGATWLGIYLSQWFARRSRRLPELAFVAAQLGYAVQEALALLDTTDARLYKQEHFAAYRSDSFNTSLAKISALCHRLNVRPLEGVQFRHEENARLKHYFTSLLTAMAPSESRSFEVGMSLGLITLRHIPYFFRYNVLGLGDDARSFLARAEEEYQQVKSHWHALTGDPAIPRSLPMIEDLIQGMRSREPTDVEVSITDMEVVIRRCDEVSKAVLGELERRTQPAQPE